MNFILAISTDQVYKEVHLPVLDDSDYELALDGEEYRMGQDLRLQMEVLDGVWKFKAVSDYRIYYNGIPFEWSPLEEGQILQLRYGEGRNLAIIVWKAPGELSAYQKYAVRQGSLSIGSSPDNTIVYSGGGVLSRVHAVIEYGKGGAVLLDYGQNGSFVNGRRVAERRALRFGDLISLFGLSIVYLGSILAVSCLNERFQINAAALRELREIENDRTVAAGPPEGEPETLIHISPRTLPKFYEEPETIEGVPAKEQGDEQPLWMAALPSLTMVLPMMIGYSMMGFGMGMAGIFITGGSAIVGAVWAVISYRFAKKKRKEKEQLRLSRYEEYLVRRADEIREKYEYNCQASRALYPDTLSCAQYDAGTQELWARKKQQSDFLFLRLGIGERPFQVKINVPARTFTLYDDELAERPSRIARSFRTMREVPLGVSLREHNVVGILTDEGPERAFSLVRTMIVQLIANHSYTDVKLGAVFQENSKLAEQWKDIRWLPHVWNEERTIRYIASDDHGADDVFYTLTQIMRARAEQLGADSAVARRSFYPHFVLFIEDPDILESQMISKYLYESGGELGITTVILADAFERLPNACEFVIERGREFQGVYAVREGGDTRQEVRFDDVPQEMLRGLVRRMSAMRVSQVESSSDIPASLTYFDMMGIHRLEELSVLNHWRKNRTYESMRALIGQKAGGQDCYLDINEKFHGPHGLVAGTTGAGKSELVQTYILSLALNFSPQDVGLFIIDFKGGGMANLFANLPHTVGQISNLSGNQIHRAMVSIKSENKRRQRIFGEFGVNHIDAYTKLVKNREATVPIPHLLIIIDEFAELKREEPEFMRELISVSQVGRSLGVHLILATQKPSGTVDDNIWSNTKFKLCLRVANKQDSNDMLHKPDAAYLTQAGRCYLQVGNDEIYELFQSGWSGATYDEGGGSVKARAVLIDLQGRDAAGAGMGKGKQKSLALQSWMERVADCVRQAARELELPGPLSGCSGDTRTRLARQAAALLNGTEDIYPNSVANLRRLEEVIALWPEEDAGTRAVAAGLIQRFQAAGKKLPEKKEKTQLDAVVGYVAEVARENGYDRLQMFWLPVLPTMLYLPELAGFDEIIFRNGRWQEHPRNFELTAPIGLVDDPENQLQYPITIDFVQRGHLTVVGGVTSGKSTFLQTLCFSLISIYSPAELNIYAIDFSSQMLTAFEEDAHFGGVLLEGEDDRLNKFFGMITEMLQARKGQVKGGSFTQYVQLHGNVLPAVLIVIDGYGNFREKTGGRFDDLLLELSRTAEGYGIYLAISCAGFGSSELQSKIADNMRQSICLELGDKYRYGEALHTMRFEVLPEQNVKGRGLVSIEGSVLEYQTALACQAENDYARSEWIKERCAEMSGSWQGKRARKIPEIPEKPTWQLFTEQEPYQEAIRTGVRLPVAYYQEDASLYSVELSRTFCYLVLGRERIGKSVFLRNLACAARDLGGTLYLVDSEGQKDRKTAELTGAEYLCDSGGLFTMVKTLIELTNERVDLRGELLEQSLEDEEIYEAMRKEYPPVFFFIADLKSFMEAIYSELPDIGALNAWVENIFEKGRLLNVFVFGALNTDEVIEVSARPAFASFIKEKAGVMLGGELDRQNVFSYQNIPYREQETRFKAGRGYAVDQEDNQFVDLIVIPQNKGT